MTEMSLQYFADKTNINYSLLLLTANQCGQKIVDKIHAAIEKSIPARFNLMETLEILEALKEKKIINDKFIDKFIIRFFSY